MAPTRAEKEITSLQRQLDVERRAHDQTRHQSTLTSNQQDAAEKQEQGVRAELESARLTIATLELLAAATDETLREEVRTFSQGNRDLQEKVEKLEARIHDVVTDRDTVRQSNDRLKQAFEDFTTPAYRLTTNTDSDGPSKSPNYASNETGSAKEPRMGICSKPEVDGKRISTFFEELEEAYNEVEIF